MFVEFGTQESHTAQLQFFFTQSNLFFVCTAKLLGTFYQQYNNLRQHPWEEATKQARWQISVSSLPT
jgi:hypothetical protein